MTDLFSTRAFLQMSTDDRASAIAENDAPVAYDKTV